MPPEMDDRSAAEQVPHVLACDVGNTHVRFAHVHGEEVDDFRTLRVGDLGEMGDALSEVWLSMPTPRKLAAASVNPTALKALEAAVSEALRERVLLVGRDLPLPIETLLPHPEAIGTDRLCCAVAAYDRLGTACVVADFGTAITIDYVSEKGVFAGGAILPGLRMASRSLNRETAQLPEVEPAAPDWVLGQDTRQAIVGGLIFGARGALRHIVEAYATESGSWPLVIATGGDAEVVCGSGPEAELVRAIVPDLCLRGVAMAYYNTLTPR